MQVGVHERARRDVRTPDACCPHTGRHGHGRSHSMRSAGGADRRAAAAPSAIRLAPSAHGERSVPGTSFDAMGRCQQLWRCGLRSRRSSGPRRRCLTKLRRATQHHQEGPLRRSALMRAHLLRAATAVAGCAGARSSSGIPPRLLQHGASAVHALARALPFCADRCHGCLHTLPQLLEHVGRSRRCWLR